MSHPRRRDKGHATGARATAAPVPLPKPLLVAVVLALAGRAAIGLAPAGAAWGVDAARHLGGAPAWLPWLLVAAALVPAVGGAGARVLRALGDMIATRSRVTRAVWGVAAATVVWLLPDETRFVGDFLLRQGGAELEVATGGVSPQTLPLERWLADQLVPVLGGGPAGASFGGRVLGAAVAAGLGVMSAGFARALGLAGVPAALTAGLALGGGVLALCTGYPRGLGALALATMVAVTGAVRAVREGRGLVLLGVGVTAALGLHRIALLLLPLLVVGAVHAARHRRLGPGPGLAALLLPVALLAWLGPRLVTQLTRNDLPLHFGRAPESALRLLDLANLALLYAPAALVALLVLAAVYRARPRGVSLVLALALVPAALVAARFTPVQGAFRDTDAFVLTGVLLALAVAAAIGACFRHRGAEPLALAVLLAGVVPTGQWLLLHHDEARATARVHAVVASWPRRPDSERALVLDFVGTRALQRSDWSTARTALAEAATLAPSPRILRAWGLAAMQVRDHASAVAAYATLTTRVPADPAAWMGRAVAELRLGRLDDARRSADSLLALPHATEVQRRVGERVRSGADELEAAAPGFSAPR
jgi:hypothetical protein